MNERTHFFIKIYLILYSRKGWCFLCVRGELETGTGCYILIQSSSDHSSTSFAFWLGCSTVGHWGPKLSVWSWFSLRWHPISNWLKPSVSWLYFCLTSTCFRLFTQVHLLTDGSVDGQYATIIPYLFFKIPHVECYFTSVSIPLTHTFSNNAQGQQQ